MSYIILSTTFADAFFCKWSRYKNEKEKLKCITREDFTCRIFYYSFDEVTEILSNLPDAEFYGNFPQRVFKSTKAVCK